MRGLCGADGSDKTGRVMVSPCGWATLPYEWPSSINVTDFEDLKSVLKLINYKMKFLLRQSVMRHSAVIQSASSGIPLSGSRLLTRRHVTILLYLVKSSTMT